MLIDCPSCHNEMYLSARFDTSKCLRCGEVVTEHTAMVPRRHAGTMPQANFQALVELRRARQCAKKHDRIGEVIALERALNYDPSLVHAHIRLGRISQDPVQRRQHLLAAQRISPDNMQVLALLGQVTASLTPQEAQALFGDETPLRAVDSVEMETVGVHCPRCRGTLEADLSGKFLVCRFCDYEEPLAETPVDHASLVTGMQEAVLNTQHRVKERVTICQECGAQWAHPTLIQTRCPSCYSQQIAVGDKLSTFMEPHGILPFTCNEEQARHALDMRLKHLRERIKGLWNPNTVKRALFIPVYIPFWVFDMPMDFRLQTEFDVVGFKSDDDPLTQTPLGNFDLGICAIENIPSRITAQLGVFYRHGMVSYTASTLNHPAEIYEIGLDRALLRARTILAMAIGSRTSRRSKQIYSSDFTGVNYWLLLAPVWMIRIFEIDGDSRAGLVNGQTGKVILGRAHRAI